MLLSLKVTISTAATVALFAAAEMASTSTASTHFSDRNSNSQSDVNRHYNIFPPFNMTDSKLVTKCAILAQHKREHRNSKKNLTVINNLNYNNGKIHETPFIQELTNDANESYLNGLPINQAKYENSPHTQGALFCRTGTWLEIGNRPLINKINNRHESDYLLHKNLKHFKHKKNYVRGTKNENNKYTILEFIAVAFGLMSIRSVSSQNYLCMDSKGEHYATPANNYNAECVFMEEMLENYYNLYSSCRYGTKNRPWYVALEKTGKMRNGRHTRKKQKSSHFLVLHLDSNNNDGIFKRKNSGDKIFESFSHSNTRVKPELLLDVMSYRQQQQQSLTNILIKNNEKLNNLFNTKTKIANTFNSSKQNSHYSNHIQATLSKNFENYGREHPTQNVDWIKYHNQNYQQKQQQYYYRLGYPNLLFPNINNNSQYYKNYNNNHYSDINNNYNNQTLSFSQNSKKKLNKYNFNTINHKKINNKNKNKINLLTEKNMFRKNLRRERRLFREEKRRKQRQEELKRLRKIALANTFTLKNA